MQDQSGHFVYRAMQEHTKDVTASEEAGEHGGDESVEVSEKENEMPKTRLMKYSKIKA